MIVADRLLISRLEQNLEIFESLVGETRALLGELQTSDQPQPKILEDEELLSITTVAKRLGVLMPSGKAPPSIYEAAERGELRGHKVGRRWRFRATEVDAWLDRSGSSRPS